VPAWLIFPFVWDNIDIPITVPAGYVMGWQAYDYNDVREKFKDRIVVLL